MIATVLLWGAVAGIVHFAVVGALYGNPWVNRWYQHAQHHVPGVRKWVSQPKYLVAQFLGTQVEVFILTAGFFWLRSSIGPSGMAGTAWLALLFAGIRVYCRFWNMWIQSTYPRRLLVVEAINGTISTFTIILILHFSSAVSS